MGWDFQKDEMNAIYTAGEDERSFRRGFVLGLAVCVVIGAVLALTVLTVLT